jgi:hypothetical protein
MQVADLVGERPLLGGEATKTEVLAELARKRDAKLIYLATHAMSDAVNPMDGSFLGLAGAHLYGRDIKSLVFVNNPLVVMSACQTGLGKVFEGGTFGLVRAWYHVGSAQIVMSLWNIDDLATKDIMLGFMRRITSGAMAEFALREAMLDTRARHPDPALWASVGLFGLPSKTPPAVTSRPRRTVLRQPPAAESPPPSRPPADGIPEPAVLHEEAPGHTSVTDLAGSAIWWTERASATGGQAPELVVRATVTIPERSLAATWSLRRNVDAALPASHVVEVVFEVPRDSPHGGIQNVPGLLMKSSAQGRSTALAGMAVKLPGTAIFLIGLSSAEADVQANVRLLTEGVSIDIPIVYENGGRAILAIRKGPSGEKAINEAFAAWSEKR